jgi:hypothetical protein
MQQRNRNRRYSVNYLNGNWKLCSHLPNPEYENMCSICFAPLFFEEDGTMIMTPGMYAKLEQDSIEAGNNKDDIISIPRRSSFEEIRNSPVVSLPCQHIFHEVCIQQWTTGHSSCPICRYKPTEFDSAFGDLLHPISENGSYIANTSTDLDMNSRQITSGSNPNISGNSEIVNGAPIGSTGSRFTSIRSSNIENLRSDPSALMNNRNAATETFET